ncbi:hypothetical protein [Streptomyces sp. NPDC059371]|uniref:hypothetical protein n=1 Tax=Streptomyces sp. NPDC059371 TaxID=3346812 RepID=UPI00368C430E
MSPPTVKRAGRGAQRGQLPCVPLPRLPVADPLEGDGGQHGEQLAGQQRAPSDPHLQVVPGDAELEVDRRDGVQVAAEESGVGPLESRSAARTSSVPGYFRSPPTVL